MKEAVAANSRSSISDGQLRERERRRRRRRSCLLPSQEHVINFSAKLLNRIRGRCAAAASAAVARFVVVATPPCIRIAFRDE